MVQGHTHTHKLSGLDYPTELACKLVWVTLRQDMLGTVPLSLSQAWSCESFRRHKSYTLYHQHCWALFVGHGQPLFGDHTPTFLPDLPERSGGWGNGRHLHGVTRYEDGQCKKTPQTTSSYFAKSVRTCRESVVPSPENDETIIS